MIILAADIEDDADMNLGFIVGGVTFVAASGNSEGYKRQNRADPSHFAAIVPRRRSRERSKGSDLPGFTDAEGANALVQVGPFDSKHPGGARYVPVGLFESLRIVSRSAESRVSCRLRRRSSGGRAGFQEEQKLLECDLVVKELPSARLYSATRGRYPASIIPEALKTSSSMILRRNCFDGRSPPGSIRRGSECLPDGHEGVERESERH